MTTVGNGQEALDAIYAEDYDCVLRDMEVPTLDGIKTTKIIRAKEAYGGEHLTIIAMTANAMQAEGRLYFQARGPAVPVRGVGLAGTTASDGKRRAVIYRVCSSIDLC